MGQGHKKEIISLYNLYLHLHHVSEFQKDEIYNFVLQFYWCVLC